MIRVDDRLMVRLEAARQCVGCVRGRRESTDAGRPTRDPGAASQQPPNGRRARHALA
jgi:hypothetical protein